MTDPARIRALSAEGLSDTAIAARLQIPWSEVDAALGGDGAEPDTRPDDDRLDRIEAKLDALIMEVAALNNRLGAAPEAGSRQEAPPAPCEPKASESAVRARKPLPAEKDRGKPAWPVDRPVAKAPEPEGDAGKTEWPKKRRCVACESIFDSHGAADQHCTNCASVPAAREPARGVG